VTEARPLHILSLGAGVQSTTMLLMALAGELEPLPDAAIFADTGWEPAAVYAHLDWCEAQMAGRVPLYRVTAGDLRADALDYVQNGSQSGWRVPYFVRDAQDKPAMLTRQCTQRYKIDPIQRQVRVLMKAAGVKTVTQWIGISLDEATRMKPSRVKYATHRWPLIERRMSRHDCLLWLERHGYPRPPKSACIGCPFHSADEWRTIKADPVAWADAVAFDAAIRDQSQPNQKRRRPLAVAYLHRSLVPLPMVDLTTPQERGQLELWDAECEGMCGV
jgi:hypothetical protein